MEYELYIKFLKRIDDVNSQFLIKLPNNILIIKAEGVSIFSMTVPIYQM